MLTSVAYTPGRTPAAQQQLIGLSAANDLGAIGEETLGRGRYGPELIEKRMRQPVVA